MLFQSRYNTLDSKLYSQQQPKPLHGAKAGHFNLTLANDLQWSDAEKTAWVDICSGKQTFDVFSPLAMVYAGHQFGHWAGQLGDGRGLLIAQVLDKNNQVIDLHLKGAGSTPYSRSGDGRAVLRSVIREYLAGHALNALGIASSNAVGFTSSLQGVQRETLEPGAMLLRTSDCHIRFGHFEWINQYAPELLNDFVMQCIAWHSPECLEQDQPIIAFAHAVVKRTAQMIADWQAVGFAHGVMNTDNLNITGSTLDFGPFGFLERFKPDWINNHSDHQGRYCYQNQPRMAHWNLSILLNNLMPLAPSTQKEAFKQQLIACLADFEVTFLKYYQEKMCLKMGLPQFHKDSFDCALHFLHILQREQLDYTQSFIRLQEQQFTALKDDCIDRDGFDAFITCYQNIRTHQDQAQLNERMQQHNPRYILRNQMAQQAIERAECDDFSEVERLFDLLATPFTPQPQREHASDVQPPHADASETAISCSS
ncbi:protein adenylyltransferase SelO [Acinetobacter rathckeae]|uniref:protein adenylyltransferase SelO n=1 Tax=Acinetobacter rathckeae TaxID=2605272 RepID=UPI0018A3015D|nr:YdiU family protein [Acinetobacter rathckeae]MBF7687766.1 YdiU family protein [Acinetobacter rathckeae]MBF7688011.1 YdiU family protein [Acinetobacter rathckeae]MBF7695935.1 YdiU family protein [Acinetobacter rathckeae]